MLLGQTGQTAIKKKEQAGFQMVLGVYNFGYVLLSHLEEPKQQQQIIVKKHCFRLWFSGTSNNIPDLL